MDKCLVLSDGKPGHLNQSLAFCELSGHDYSVVEIIFRNRLCKVLSYLFDRIGFYTPSLYRLTDDATDFSVVVSAGSQTYYANRTLATKNGARAVSVMLPSGYRYRGFDLIIAQEHDHPPSCPNIKTLPINLCHVKPGKIFQPDAGQQYVGLVIGGPNKVFQMESNLLQQQIEQISKQFPDHHIVVATSRRTPNDVEAMLKTFDFATSWIYSVDPVNPIPDFLTYCDYVFITADSTSMISEAVSYGKSAVEILPLADSGRSGKFNDLVKGLAKRGCVHLFDGNTANSRAKIDLASELQGVL